LCSIYTRNRCFSGFDFKSLIFNSRATRDYHFEGHGEELEELVEMCWSNRLIVEVLVDRDDQDEAKKFILAELQDRHKEKERERERERGRKSASEGEGEQKVLPGQRPAGVGRLQSFDSTNSWANVHLAFLNHVFFEMDSGLDDLRRSVGSNCTRECVIGFEIVNQE
jgi:hypothetical protein